MQEALLQTLVPAVQEHLNEIDGKKIIAEELNEVLQGVQEKVNEEVAVAVQSASTYYASELGSC